MLSFPKRESWGTGIMADDWYDENWRDKEIKPDKNYAWLMRVTRGAVLIGIGILIGIILFADSASRQSYVINVFTGILGLGATALIFDELNRKRSRDELKQQLKIDAASISNEFAKNAIHQLYRRKWLKGDDGLLKGQDLTAANLQGAGLLNANLEGADLTNSNLLGANLIGSNLQGAKLIVANLQWANLHEANLQEADLRGASFHYAKLPKANLRYAVLISAKLIDAILYGADLREAHLNAANLQGAFLAAAKFQGADMGNAVLRGARLINDDKEEAEFDEKTRLPDGNFWDQKTDMQKFTDPYHPDFWRSPVDKENGE